MIIDILSRIDALPSIVAGALILVGFLVPVPLSISFAVIGSAFGLPGVLWAGICVPVAALTLHAVGLRHSKTISAVPYVGRHVSKIHSAKIFPLVAFAVPFWPFFLAAGLLKRSKMETILVALIVSLPVALSVGLGVAVASVVGLPNWSLSAGALLVLVIVGVGRSRMTRRAIV